MENNALIFICTTFYLRAYMNIYACTLTLKYVRVYLCYTLLLQSEQYSTEFVGTSEGVPNDAGYVQVRPRVPAQVRHCLQL